MPMQVDDSFAAAADRQGVSPSEGLPMSTARSGGDYMTNAPFHSSPTALVGVFDVLGFKRIMTETKDLESLARRLDMVFAVVEGCGHERTVFEVHGSRSQVRPIVLQASDSFIVYLDVRAPADLIQFLWNTSQMLFYAVHHEIPMRGALATGTALISDRRPMFLGSAVLEAYQLERVQDWAGASVAPSLESYINEQGLRDYIFPLVIPYSVPMQHSTVGANRKQRLALNWMADWPNWIAPEFVREKFPSCNASTAGFDRVQRKIENTCAFAEYANVIRGKHGCFASPDNRRIQLDDVGDGLKRVRFIIDERP